jgi:transposase InsO family protein
MLEEGDRGEGWQELYQKQREDPDLLPIIQYLSDPKSAAHDLAPDVFRAVKAKINDKNTGYQLTTGLLLHVKATTNGRLYRVVAPQSMKVQLIKYFHSIASAGHLGVTKTMSRLQERFWWKKMRNDISNFIRDCPCALRKLSDRTKAGKLQSFQSQKFLDCVGIDLVGPLPKSREGGFRYILTMVDHHTRWPVAIPIKSKEAENVADGIYDFICDKGCPKRILSDQGTEFLAKVVKRLCKRLGIDKVQTTAFAPTTNGACERFHRTMSASLANFVNNEQTDWPKYLPAILMAYRTSALDGMSVSPYELVYGRKPSLPTDVIYGRPEDTINDWREFGVRHTEALRRGAALVRSWQAKRADKNKRAYDKHHYEVVFLPGEEVYILQNLRLAKGLKRKLANPKDPRFGPHEVLQRMGPVTYSILRSDNGKVQTVHARRLRLRVPFPGPGEDHVGRTTERVELEEPADRRILSEEPEVRAEEEQGSKANQPEDVAEPQRQDADHNEAEQKQVQFEASQEQEIERAIPPPQRRRRREVRKRPRRGEDIRRVEPSYSKAGRRRQPSSRYAEGYVNVAERRKNRRNTRRARSYVNVDEQRNNQDVTFHVRLRQS